MAIRSLTQRRGCRAIERFLEKFAARSAGRLFVRPAGAPCRGEIRRALAEIADTRQTANGGVRVNLGFIAAGAPTDEVEVMFQASTVTIRFRVLKVVQHIKGHETCYTGNYR